jgi:hypothetical protein
MPTATVADRTETARRSVALYLELFPDLRSRSTTRSATKTRSRRAGRFAAPTRAARCARLKAGWVELVAATKPA